MRALCASSITTAVGIEDQVESKPLTSEDEGRGGTLAATCPATGAATRTKAIETIVKGDTVWATPEDDPTAEPRLCRVVEVYRRTSDHLRVLTIRDSEGVEQELRTTDDHPFYVMGSDQSGWANAARLVPGDRLMQRDGSWSTMVATEREEHPEGVPVFNFQVEEAHTYFVRGQGATGAAVWVHNAKYDKHHSINKAIGGKSKQHLYSVERDLEHLPFHRQFQANLNAGSIPIQTMGGRGAINSATKIEAYFLAVPGSQR